MSSTIMKHFLWELFICILLLIQGVASISYGTALKKSLLYFEAQRSGKLPSNQRVKWRGDSAVNDSDVNIDLSGGYYDSGDNVKYGFPMAFTTTLLAMSVVDFREELKAKKELANALHAVKWATDYMIKAHPEPNVLYGEVGDGKTDHGCWQRPEDMTTPRTSYKIDADHPGSDLAAETAAALAAASIAFNDTDPNYSVQLLTHAEQLFEFASNHPGLYHKSIKVASKFYSSSRDEDELGWAAGWLFRATGDTFYIRYINGLAGQGGTRTTFSWDDKYTGSQLLIARYVMFYGYDKVGDKTKWRNYKRNAEEFLCQWLGLGLNNLKKTPGGLVWWEQQWNPLQYTTSASLLAVSYAKYLDHANQIALCENGRLTPDKLISFARTQVNYILGSNPKKFSYMVGYGTHYPKRVHHRGASIVSIKEDPTPVTCKGGFENWFNRNESNPNVLEGAIVGGPDENDEYQDSRVNYEQAEPATVNTAPLVGVLAKLASIYG